MTTTLRPFRFAPAAPHGFRLVVHARSLLAARRYVAAQAISSIPHRALRYVGEGHPPDPAGWCAAAAR